MRDHEDNFVAQTMSRAIQVTDDHKSNPLGSQTFDPQIDFMERSDFPGVGVFNQTTLNHPATSRQIPRNAFSATDLYGLQNQYNPMMSGQLRAPSSAQQGSEAISATQTPRNLSRPASPTMPFGQQSKRRKASGSNRIFSDLKMTPAHPITQSNALNLGSVTSEPSYPPAASDFSPNFPSPRGASGYVQIPPYPTSQQMHPLNGDHDSQIGHRSRSMDHLPHHNSMTSGPSSIQSGKPSPTSVPMSNELIQANGTLQEDSKLLMNESNLFHAQQLANTLQLVNQARTPVIHKLTPAEGSTAGGYEVICLGSGFGKGMQVMFGTALAITTELWGDSALTCIVPPAQLPCEVNVTFKHLFDQQSTTTIERQKTFRYVDNDQPELLAQLLSMLGGSVNPQALQQDAVRGTAQQLLSRGTGSVTNGAATQTIDQGQQIHPTLSTMPDAEVEEVMLRCLEFLDLDDSPRRVDYNSRRPKNGQGMLHLAASLGYYRVAAGLLARGAHPDMRDRNGMSPMHVAALRGNTRIIRKLRSAGGDPNLRSLAGFTPVDMATSRQAHNAVSVIEYHARSPSATATPMSSLSRATSVVSRVSSNGDYAGMSHDDERVLHTAHSVTPGHFRARSRRASYSTEEHQMPSIDPARADNASQLAAQSALTAWRDQLSAQIQHFQQTVHRALPPLPNLPDYQGYPVVRRISSLVPQRNSQSTIGSNASANAKEADIGWWELLTGSSASPPAYEDIYPEGSKGSQQDVQDKKQSTLHALGEAFMDRACSVAFDQGQSSREMEVVNIGSKGLTQEQQDRLRSAHAHKMKRLRSDRKLFFIWVCSFHSLCLTFQKTAADRDVDSFTFTSHCNDAQGQAS